MKNHVLEYCVSEGIGWYLVEEGDPDSSRQVLCTYKGKNGYEIGTSQYRLLTQQELLEHPEAVGFCKCQYKNAQKVENKNVHFPKAIPRFATP